MRPVDIKAEELKLARDLVALKARLFIGIRKSSLPRIGLYKNKGGGLNKDREDRELYDVLGVKINTVSRSKAILAKKYDNEHDPFDLERPISVSVLVVQVDPYDPKVMVGQVETIELTSFKENFEPFER